MMKPALPPDEPERLQVLHALGILDTPPEPAFDRLTRLLARVLDVPIALVTLVDADRQWFKSRVGLAATETPREVSFCAHAILQSGPLVVADATTDPRFADNPAVTSDPNVRFYAGVPLRTSAGHALGTLCAVDSKPRTLGPDEMDVLFDLAELANKEIRQREAIRFAHDEILRTDAARLASEGRFRSVFERAPVGIALVAPDGGWIGVNDALCRIVGYPPDELQRLTFQDITHPEDLHLDLERLDQLARGEVDRYQMEKRYLRKDGAPVWVALSVSKKTAADGALEYFVAIVTDIQARKDAEAALLELRRDLERRVESRTLELSDANRMLREVVEGQERAERDLRTREAELASVIENANDAYVAMDASGIVTAWNRQAEETFGWPMDEALGQRLDELIVPPGMRQAHRMGMARYLQTGKAKVLNQRLELPALRRDGSTLVVEIRIRALELEGRTIFSAFLHDISQRKQAEAAREREARHDALTGLLNRRALTELLPLARARADRGGLPLALLFIDLDGFKTINDARGHDAGDMVLRTVAERLRASIRRTDTAIRLGGDEFVVLLEGLQGGLDDALAVADGIRERLAQPIPLTEGSATIGASIGIAGYAARSGVSPDDLIAQADAAMYDAKRAGRGRVAVAGA